MDFKQLQEEFRKLEVEAGKKTSNALVSIMELRATQFEKNLQAMGEKMEFRATQFEKNLQAMGEKFENKFDAMDEKFGNKFDAIDQKFGNKFDAIDQKFDSMEKRFSTMQWMITLMITLGFSMLGILIVLF